MASEFKAIFSQLRGILERHSHNLLVDDHPPASYSLTAEIGPTTLQAWGGKLKKQRIPVAWVHINKSYVSFHLMGLYMNQALQQGISKELKTRMQGKSCFNFKVPDEKLFRELDALTIKSIDALRKGSYVTNSNSRKRTSRKQKH